uniref:C-type lectin domain-containing protein n=1 Tax=Amphiprion percula TaxID=161767 RepID=A0A3P8RPE0_AMPPE
MQRSLFLLMVMGQCSFLACHEYHFIEDKKTWHDAQKYCREKYTDLATVYDMEDMRRLQNAAKNQTEAWIGLRNAIDGNKTWHWSLPGVEFKENETNWGPEEPNDEGSNENYGVISKDRSWIDISYKEEYPFMCYDDRSNDQEIIQEFIVVEKHMCWTEAQEYCRQNHTDLVSGLKQLNDSKVISLLENATGSCCWLFGLFRDTWRWSDGSQSSFRNWDHHPNSEDCAMTTLNGESKWKSDNCSSQKPFFCYNEEVVLIKENKTWEDALYYCREHHYDLVSITGPDQQRMVQERAKRANSPFVWVGLGYTCTLDFWFWVTDEVVDYKNWASGGKIDECDMSGAVDRGGQQEWFSKNDSMEFNFICWV